MLISASFKIGDYVEGTEHTLPCTRRSKGWITRIHENFGTVDVRADDEFGGARGTMFDIDSLVKLPSKSQPA